MRATGVKAEETARAYLERCGLTIIANNVVFPFGEIDLVASDKGTLVFVEVKYRKSLAYGNPQEAVTVAKQRKIILAAKAYMQKLKPPIPPCRFDVIALWGDVTQPQIEHIEDAFWEEDYRW